MSVPPRWCLIILFYSFWPVAKCMPALKEPRLSLADVATSYNIREPEGPDTYAFGYDINDPDTENVQFRDEERKPDGSVVGKYGWLGMDGTAYIVNYVADSRGYRASVDTVQNYLMRRRSRSNPFMKIT
ncbi:hypothetical protein HUJ04_002802 [Dendroctonus ponderosae]|uniref:Uncharacterized protein n=1 Tax=Dendroctonus ponderosae TaxID=77166 RepID=A0AAR5QJH9_DENPD|nr:hypothetical protein HUJ04_002802 [Dendroctonus ponderosae]